MNSVYPSIGELLPEILLARVPALLVEDITERYQALGTKYLTGQLTDDGRRINGCMFKSSIQDALEEVVDATFNTLVWMFKIGEGTKPPEMVEAASMVLEGLIQIYTILVVERESDAATG